MGSPLNRAATGGRSYHLGHVSIRMGIRSHSSGIDATIDFVTLDRESSDFIGSSKSHSVTIH